MLISALPRRPTDYAALPANFGPRPRTVKMVSRPAGLLLFSQPHRNHHRPARPETHQLPASYMHTLESFYMAALYTTPLQPKTCCPSFVRARTAVQDVL